METQSVLLWMWVPAVVVIVAHGIFGVTLGAMLVGLGVLFVGLVVAVAARAKGPFES